ncbi:MAG: hypothetical protein EOP45_08780 [Sphingobacteriaceae bacterium]|nr:MAG: hypothetical protein EOP45_08780 [Sphingobacteriaceae bacterium]
MYYIPKHLRIFFAVNFLLFFNYCYAQNVEYPQYHVISATVLSSAQKEALNRNVSQFKELRKVLGIINPYIVKYKSRMILKAFSSKSTYSYLYITKPNNDIIDLSKLVTESKGGSSTKIDNIADFKTFLRDTVAVLDTLALIINYNNTYFPRSGYFFQLLNSSGNIIKEINLVGGPGRSILIYPLIFDQVNTNVLNLELHNHGTPLQVLSSFHLRFVGNDKTELESLTNTLLQDNPSINLNNLSNLLRIYLRPIYGTINQNEISSWLKKHYPNLS